MPKTGGGFGSEKSIKKLVDMSDNANEFSERAKYLSSNIGPLEFSSDKTGLSFKPFGDGSSRMKIFENGKEIGNITAGIFTKNGSSELNIADIGLYEMNRGKGVGKAIVDSFKEYSNKTGLPLYATEVMNDSVGFWKKMGFSIKNNPGPAGVAGNAFYKPIDVWNKIWNNLK